MAASSVTTPAVTVTAAAAVAKMTAAAATVAAAVVKVEAVAVVTAKAVAALAVAMAALTAVASTICRGPPEAAAYLGSAPFTPAVVAAVAKGCPPPPHATTLRTAFSVTPK